ncbi:hypothetical protein BCON_0116g00220 [Botryotinia convoluta]|uniref:Uncharacterized protein n=1 Tax=Botryotinia convoluta TaxID=54673 RepID=A0A4Z1HXD4_9HELO|nr:hypothetical protein BCON_0116g00220 [Botryotinia convoluta]
MDGRRKVAHSHISGAVKKRASVKEYRDNSTGQANVSDRTTKASMRSSSKQDTTSNGLLDSAMLSPDSVKEQNSPNHSL